MMEFEDQHDAEEDEELDDDDDEEHTIELPATANYDSSLPNTSSRPFKMPTPEPTSPPSPPPLPLSLSFPAGKKPPSAPARYRECLKNHAVTLGGHAVDGCGEFLPAGPDGSLDALKCAACNCHRNFHRKEVDPNNNNNHQIHHPISYFPHPHPQHHPIFQFYPYGRTSSPQQGRQLALPSPGSGGGRSGGGEVDEAEMISDPMSAMGLGTSSSGKKRFRTKFTPQQKEKMMELAEKLEWRLQKQDEATIAQFCEETGVRRHVLKVWMHNNKHTLGKRNTTTTNNNNHPIIS